MLGTPPAFILSQDRTLTFKDVHPGQNLSLAFVLSVITFGLLILNNSPLSGLANYFVIPKLLLSQNTNRNDHLSASKLARAALFALCPAQCFLEFFRVALLFICQGASLLLFSAATHLE